MPGFNSLASRQNSGSAPMDNAAGCPFHTVLAIELALNRRAERNIYMRTGAKYLFVASEFTFVNHLQHSPNHLVSLPVFNPLPLPITK